MRCNPPTRRRRRPLALVPSLLLVLLMAACGSGPSPQASTGSAQPSPTRPPKPSVQTSTPSASGLKPIIQGLIDRVGPPPLSYLKSVSNFVINAPWSELQATPEGPLTKDNVIDQAIAAARSLEKTLGTGKVGIKIRLLAGIDAPDWAKQLGGAPVAVLDPQSGSGGTIGRFWTSAFGHAYDDLWAKLAAAYDSVLEVREITVARCMTVFDEPFIRNVSDPTTVRNLVAAGFSAAADLQCEEQEIDDGTMWHQTRVGVAFNPYQTIGADGMTSTAEAVTEQMMGYCRSRLGLQCVLENNSIRYPPLTGAYAEMYTAMQQLGPPISFQTEPLDRVGNLEATLTWAVSVGADAVELPQGYREESAASFQAAATLLEENPA